MKTVKFEELGLSNEVIMAIADLGFEETTPIQAQAIPLLLEGRDVIGQAQTGTGKTAAFGIPAIERLDPKSKKPQVLVLCPTRELAIQVAGEISKLLKYFKGVYELPIYGGQPIERQIRALNRGAQIIIGTPGRMLDHLNRRTLSLDDIKTVILDEADEMLNMGFRPDIEKILNRISRDRQTVMFSATMSEAVLKLARTYQQAPETVRVVHEKLTVPAIEQEYFEVTGHERMELLGRLIDSYNPSLAIVFCNTKRRVDNVTEKLTSRGYLAVGIHGGLSQRQRDSVMKKFRSGTADILVATDVAARGIDVGNIELVINFDMPNDVEYYVHRIGRTGRAGRGGRASSFVMRRDLEVLMGIEEYTKTKVKRGSLPAIGEEKPKTDRMLDKVVETLKKGGLTSQTQRIEGLLDLGYKSVELAAALLTIAEAKPKAATPSAKPADSKPRAKSYARPKSDYPRSDRPSSSGRKPFKKKKY